ncbi:MAG: hypothetical protein ABIT37_05900 [Luteolibacter sp.]
MTHTLSILAETAAAAPDQLISGDWLIAIVKAIILALGVGGASWIVAMKKGEAKGKSMRMTLGEPVPEIPVRRVYSPPSFSQHMDLVRRVEKVEEIAVDLRNDFQQAMTDIRKDSAKQYVEILTAGHERENRLTDKLDGIAKGFHARVDELVKVPPPKQ